ncbi:hypothetical protein [Heterosigma akashiwo virus 01]|jgi:hypothetical protein|uniref:Uncharacterized protein n=1 Tax=Heterosigma akashiwo virus 01 TaxID=97195 RepID=A0A1C9C530_HAV01|nr:hypothetical protein D1R72_gp067 [Heterosigma akashiwo virus 01]AOM63398.1 hypothetical protein [Heterosigma akashiwo virus 01]
MAHSVFYFKSLQKYQDGTKNENLPKILMPPVASCIWCLCDLSRHDQYIILTGKINRKCVIINCETCSENKEEHVFNMCIKCYHRHLIFITNTDVNLYGAIFRVYKIKVNSIDYLK